METLFKYEDVKNRPISQTELYGMTKSDQISYIKNLSSRFNASCPMISSMLKMNPTTLRSHMYSLGYNFTKTGKKSSSSLDDWERFCGMNVVADGYIASDTSIKSTVADVTSDDTIDSIKKLANYNDNIAALNMFIEETCIVSADHLKTRFDVLRETYRLWCSENGFSSFTSEEFCEILKSEYKSTFTKKSGYIYCDNIFLKMNILKLYRNRIYSLKPNESPYYNSRPTNDTSSIKEKTDNKDVFISSKKKENKKSSSFVMVNSSGTYTYEGIPSDIFSDVSNKLDNKKMRIKIEWEIIL